MSSSDKKSLSPRPTQDCGRIPKGRVVNKSAVKKTAPTARQVPDQVVSEDGDLVQSSSVKLGVDHVRTKETLEEGLRDAEERLHAMKMLMEESERRHAARMEEASKRTKSLEGEVDSLEKQLIEHNINPVTSQTEEASLEESQAVEKQRKVTKDDVKRMRCKLKEMNDKSDRFLVDIQHILQELTDLQEASSRAGGSSLADMPIVDLHLKMCDHEQTVEAIRNPEYDGGSSSSPAEMASHTMETAQETQLVPSSGVFFTETT